MITVAILINGEPIVVCSAVNKGYIFADEEIGHPKVDMCRYETTVGTTLHHSRGDGAIKLAKKMLDSYAKQEKKGKKFESNADFIRRIKETIDFLAEREKILTESS